jgi:hypothetical protein
MSNPQPADPRIDDFTSVVVTVDRRKQNPFSANAVCNPGMIVWQPDNRPIRLPVSDRQTKKMCGHEIAISQV